MFNYSRISSLLFSSFISLRLKFGVLAVFLFSFGASAVAAVPAVPAVAAVPAVSAVSAVSVINEALVIASLKSVLPFFMFALFSGFVAGFAPAMLVKFLREILK